MRTVGSLPSAAMVQITVLAVRDDAVALDHTEPQHDLTGLRGDVAVVDGR